MKLENSVIKTLIIGAARVWDTPDGLKYSRLSETQAETWKKESEWFNRIVTSGEGVILDFDTNSEYFAFTISEKSNAEIWVDGLFFKNFIDATEVKCDFSPENRSDMRHIICYLPSNGAVRDFAVSDGAETVKHKYERKILFIGDSITNGACSHYEGTSYPNVTARALNAERFITGVGGGYFLPAFFEKTEFKPDIVIVAFGTNDFSNNESFDVIKEKAEAFLWLVSKNYRNKKLFCISPIWRKTDKKLSAGENFSEYCEKLKTVISDSDFTLIEGDKLVPHDERFFDDGELHPNAIGHYMYAENLIKFIQRKI